LVNQAHRAFRASVPGQELVVAATDDVNDRAADADDIKVQLSHLFFVSLLNAEPVSSQPNCGETREIQK
jgi:hypothetical protein